VNCSSSNIIYLITCTKCHKQYVGETSRKLKDRLNDHKSHICAKKNTAIAVHFQTATHKLKYLTITPMQQFPYDDKDIRLNRVKYWIKTLNTAYPYGLNNYPIDK